MRWLSFSVLAGTLIFMASLSLVAAVPTRTTSGAAPRALKQYKMKRGGNSNSVKRDEPVDSGDGESNRHGGHHHDHPKPSHWPPPPPKHHWNADESSA
ncbi:hypothetical protein DXG01_008840 [Tephrocybe rancida]|nr:hypothetical protein DXG01_008840 [Tephrocybe rancida]